MYGERLERVVLFGSRARGDAHENYDYDVAVFLHDMADRWQEFRPPGRPQHGHSR
ncbi:MAG TPA: nucleotidyltransferase domain-containing protein [Stellaceae bacterium]|nr:nucleotidyltransferase domain-containing protein [Stellaceae bacterium]